MTGAFDINFSELGILRDPIHSHTYIYMEYEGPDGLHPLSASMQLRKLLQALEHRGANVADRVKEVESGTDLPNPWNRKYSAGPLGSPLSVAVSAHKNAVGLGDDRFGQLVVSAALSGVVAIRPADLTRAGAAQISVSNLSFLGHEVRDLQYVWRLSLETQGAEEDCYAVDVLSYSVPLATAIPRVRVARGSFWDLGHIEVRNLFFLVMRELRNAGVMIEPIDNVISADTRKASSIIQSQGEALDQIQVISERYKSSTDLSEIILLPTCPVPAPRRGRWLSHSSMREADPLEFLMPSVLAGLTAISIPCGFTVDGLPVGLQIISPAARTAEALLLATWYQGRCSWPTIVAS